MNDAKISLKKIKGYEGLGSHEKAYAVFVDYFNIKILDFEFKTLKDVRKSSDYRNNKVIKDDSLLKSFIKSRNLVKNADLKIIQKEKADDKRS